MGVVSARTIFTFEPQNISACAHVTGFRTSGDHVLSGALYRKVYGRKATFFFSTYVRTQV